MSDHQKEKLDLAEIVIGYRKGLSVIAKAFTLFSDKIAPYSGVVKKFETSWADAQRRLDEMPRKSKAAMALASSKGWFFGWEQSLEDVLTLIEEMVQIESSKVDDLLCNYYRKHLTSMAQRLTSMYPERARPINAAVKAHQELGNEGFCLAVPVFIAQADGLLTEITGVKSAFLAASRTPGAEAQASEALRLKLESDPDSLALATQFLNLRDQEFLKSANNRKAITQTTGNAFSALNRHQVMHGESSDYGTEMNSLKAFSLLAAVGLHLPLVFDEFNAQ